MSFAIEKRRQLFLVLVIFALLQLQFGWWFIPVWILFIGLLYFYRDFSRKPPAKPLDVLSPVDGVVTGIAQEINPFLKSESMRVRLRQFVRGEFNFHSPIEGTIKQCWWPGKQSSDTPEGHSYAWWIQTDEGDDVVYALLPRWNWFKSIHCSVHTGERIGQGKRCGFAGYNLEVSIYLPANSVITASEGDKLLAGLDSIGHFVHNRNDNLG